MTLSTKTAHRPSSETEPPAAPPPSSSGSINWKVQLITALITAITTLTIAYWQFHPTHSNPDRATRLESLRGEVHGDDGKVLQGASVSLLVGKESRQVITDSNGNFFFDGLTPADGQITVFKDQYNTYVRTLTSDSYRDILQVSLVHQKQDANTPVISQPTVDEVPGPHPYRARAEANIGWSYETGDGARPNYQAAMEWYERAVKDGDVIANWNIARLYEFGLVGPQDLNRAQQWYKRGADLGDQRAMQYLNNLGNNPRNP